VVDASVVALAVARGANIVSGDLQDLKRLVAAARADVSVHEV
jgi:hypothetical protein